MNKNIFSDAKVQTFQGLPRPGNRPTKDYIRHAFFSKIASLEQLDKRLRITTKKKVLKDKSGAIAGVRVDSIAYNADNDDVIAVLVIHRADKNYKHQNKRERIINAMADIDSIQDEGVCLDYDEYDQKVIQCYGMRDIDTALSLLKDITKNYFIHYDRHGLDHQRYRSIHRYFH